MKKQKDEKETKKPFNVFRKPITYLLGGFVITSALAFAGCSDGVNGKDGKDGANGVDGSVWHSGTEVSQVVDFKVGDYFFDTDDYNIYKYGSNGWELISNIKGEQGEQGEQGPQGEQGEPGISSYTYVRYASDANGTDISITPQEGLNYICILTTNSSIPPENSEFKNWIKFVGEDGKDGDDGASVWLGYDGYIWIGNEPTSVSYNKDLITDYTAENTLELFTVGNKYFNMNTVDVSTEQVALMGNYFSNIDKTGYSDLSVSKITIYCNKTGQLAIGTANVADIVESRTNGSSLVSNVLTYEVVEGLNEIDLNLILGENETIIFGGTGTTAGLSLYYVEGVNGKDEYGYFTTINNLANSELLNTTTIEDVKYNDKLILKVDLSVTKTEVSACVGMSDIYSSVSQTGLQLNAFNRLVFNDLTMFENKTITSLKAPFRQIAENQVFTIYVISQSDAQKSSWKDMNLEKKYEIKIDSKCANDINTFKTLDLSSYNIVVGEGETLAFGKDTDTVNITYGFGGQNVFEFSAYQVSISDKYDGVFKGLPIDIYYLASNTTTMKDHLDKLKAENDLASTNNFLKDKTLSILGDSISTYRGYSNSTEVNNTLGSNFIYYPDNASINVDETWWKQIVDKNNMSLLVNNSASSSRVYGSSDETNACGNRAINLHDNTLDNNPNQTIINPDIIAVYMGTNDFYASGQAGTLTESRFTEIEAAVDSGEFTPTTFAEGYTMMIYKMLKTYPTTDIFCFNLPNLSSKELEANSLQKLQEMNEVIEQIVQHYFDSSKGIYLVDLYNSELNSTITSDILIDNIHPNANGFDIITEVFEQKLIEVYSSK